MSRPKPVAAAGVIGLFTDSPKTGPTISGLTSSPVAGHLRFPAMFRPASPKASCKSSDPI